MIRAGYNLIAFAVKAICLALLALVVLGILPPPLLWWLATEAVQAAWAFLNLPPFVQGVGVAALVYFALARWFHNAPLKAQREAAMAKALADYERQKW